MEDVLEVYQRPHDPDRPVVCLDETTKQLIKETRVPVPAKPGQPTRHDYEYERNGTANLFMLFAPLEGWRHVEVTDRHAALDYAQILKDLSDRHYPGASKIVLVQDNLSTHKPASLYEAFPAAEARRLVERFEWHYTPKHGSWLDMAEIELSVLSRQCLDRRIPNKQALIEEVAAWEEDRNKNHTKADWQFTTAEARIKLSSNSQRFSGPPDRRYLRLCRSGNRGDTCSGTIAGRVVPIETLAREVGMKWSSCRGESRGDVAATCAGSALSQSAPTLVRWGGLFFPDNSPNPGRQARIARLRRAA